MSNMDLQYVGESLLAMRPKLRGETCRTSGRRSPLIPISTANCGLLVSAVYVLGSVVCMRPVTSLETACEGSHKPLSGLMCFSLNTGKGGS